MSIRTYLFVTFFSFFVNTLMAQPSLSGPLCTVGGTIYEYVLTTNSNEVAEISICVKGGEIQNEKNTCISVVQNSIIRITWNSNKPENSITIKYTGGEKKTTIQVTHPLLPGEIKDADKKQKIKSNNAGKLIQCSPASGGYCSPSYAYQWQKSTDGNQWTDIIGATNADLDNQGNLSKPIFYRRKVVELTTGSVGYSGLATVFVEID